MPDPRQFDTRVLPARILSGAGCRSKIAEIATELDAHRILVVVSSSLKSGTGILDPVVAALGPRLAGIFDGAKTHGPLSALREGYEVARSVEADAVLSVGGGAVHDTAKAIALMVPNAGDILGFAIGSPAPRDPARMSAPLPYMAIPSTLSAAEVTNGGGVTDPVAGEKFTFGHRGLAPAAVFLDGDVVASTPAGILATTGLNAVHHCVEAVCSTRCAPLARALALDAFRTLVAVLPNIAPPGATPVISDLQDAVDAAALSGMTYINSGLGIGHAVCHVLGGRFGLSHGAANAVMLPHTVRFNFAAAAGPLTDLAASAQRGDGDPSPDRALAICEGLQRALGVPTRLRDIGVSQGDLSELVALTMGNKLLATNPRPVLVDDVAKMLNAAW